MENAEKQKILEEIRVLKERIKELEAKIAADEFDNEQLTIDDLENELEEAEKKLRDKLNQEIEKFNVTAEKFRKNIEKVKASLILETDLQNMNITQAIEGLTSELGSLEKEAETLAADIEDFKTEINSEGLTLTEKDIKNKIKEFKTRLVELKKSQIEKYNLRVEFTNKILNEYKEKVPVNTEVYYMVMNMPLLSLCTASVNDWRHNSYLASIDYNKLIEVNNQFKVIDEKIENMKSLADELNQELDFINEKIVELDVIVSDDIGESELTDAQSKVENLSELLLAFGTKLESVMSDKKITQEEYKLISERYQSYMVSYLTFVKAVNKKKPEKESEYDNLVKAVDVLGTNAEKFAFRVDALYGMVSPITKKVFDDEMLALDASYNDILNEVEEKHKEQLIDDNQYNSLINKLNHIREKLTQASLKKDNSKMYMMQEDLIFGFLNGEIDGIEKTLDYVGKLLEAMDKPIKDRKQRKQIDAIFKKLELEIKSLEKQLEENKEVDEEKYNATKERLQAAKKKMENLNKNYRRKCPLLVRTVKSAKNFFKKYKKQLLIIAGLVAFAMMAHTIIIPAIMYGNALMANTSPLLMRVIYPVNKLLAGLIGATQNSQGLWLLANGAALNSGAASASLLKGLALSGVGNTMLIAPVVVAVKKLIEKMNMAELKQKLAEGKDKVVGGVKKGFDATKKTIKNGTGKVVGGAKKKIAEISDKNKKRKSEMLAMKGMKETIKNTIADYAKSGLSVEEYCEKNNLDEFMADVLRMYDEEVRENRENLDKKRGSK